MKKESKKEMTPEIKTRFTEYVDSMLATDFIKEVFHSHMDKVPEEFFTAPASSSGKYHPDYSLGEGGLVRHSATVVFLAMDIGQLWHVQGPARDSVVLAAAVHDSFKGGRPGEWEGTVKNHADLAADALLEQLPKAQNTLEQKCLITASDAVREHMSLWGMSPTNLRATEHVASTVIMADYMASRKYFEPANDLAELISELGYQGKEVDAFIADLRTTDYDVVTDWRKVEL